MREIKFRGKLPSTDIWIYGHLVEQFGAKSLKFPRCYIVSYDEKIENYDWERPRNVERKSVGQFTEAHDYNGKEIYEGDICQLVDDKDNYELYVAWDEEDCGFAFYTKSGKKSHFKFDKWVFENFRIIGNIFDNPEMLKGADHNEN